MQNLILPCYESIRQYEAILLALSKLEEAADENALDMPPKELRLKRILLAIHLIKSECNERLSRLSREFS
jgi:hypothetical protein